MTIAKTIAIVALAAAIAAPALAQDAPEAEADLGTNFYLGVGGAQFNTAFYDDICRQGCADKEDKRPGVILYGGYRGSPYFGGEFGYGYARGLDASNLTFRRRARYQSIYGAGVVRSPVFGGRIHLVGKVGAHYYRREDTIDNYEMMSDNSGEVMRYVRGARIGGASVKTQGIRPMFGAGVELSIGNGGLRADWMRLYGSSDRDDADVIAVRYIYHF